jgi:nucleolar protein 14
MQRRNKVGGILDRRFGEDDATMTPEDKMLERFAREKQHAHKKSAMFDLEDDDESGGYSLTHMGQSLSLDGKAIKDDFEEDDIDAVSDGDSDAEGKRAYLKRKQLTDANPEGEGGDVEDEQPERKKTKQEVYSEIIAKSKAHKYERQAAKEDDEDLRMELDKELPNLQQLLLFRGKDAKASALQDHGAVASAENKRLDREYDLQVKKLAQDRRAQPSERTKTAEEKADEEAARLNELEAKRLRRMEGEKASESDSDDGDATSDKMQENGPVDFTETDDEDDFGLGKGIKTRPTATELGFDDEDDFLIEEFVASDPELSPEESDDSSQEEDEGFDENKTEENKEEDEDEFTKGLLTELEAHNPVFSTKTDGATQDIKAGDVDSDGLPYTFDCPQSHDELLGLIKNIPVEKLITVIQRIRLLYHPKLDSSNKTKLANFSKILIQHLRYLSSLSQLPPFSVLGNLIRHIHSLAKAYAIEVAEEFRSQLVDLGKRPLAPTLGDFVVLTAIGTICECLGPHTLKRVFDADISL